MRKTRLGKNIKVNFESLKKAVELFPSISDFSEAIEVSYQTGYSLYRGAHKPTIPTILKIEEITKGAVRAEDIAPTLMWPMMREKYKND